MRRFNYGSFKSKSIPFIGGLNEDTNTIKMGPADLIDCLNYEVLLQDTSGYKSVDGYERWDGSVADIEFPAGSGQYISVGFPSEVPVTYDDNGQLIDDTERELRRSQIQAVPGEGPVVWAGVHKNQLYAIRKDIGVSTYSLYVATNGEADGNPGWAAVTDGTSAITFDFGTEVSHIRVVEGSLAFWPSTSPNTPIILVYPIGGTNGNCYVIHMNDVSFWEADSITTITAAPTGAIEAAVLFNNRIYVSYSPGHLMFTKLGEPDFTNDLGTAGEIFFSSAVTDLVSAPGDALVIFKETGISILKNIEAASANTNAIVTVDTFSDHGSNLPGTAVRFMGTVINCNNRGISTLETTSAFGDFEANDIGSKVSSKYSDLKSSILSGVANQATNQYLVFTSSGKGLSLTFDDQKRVVGRGYFDLDFAINSVTYGFIQRLDRECFIFGTQDGYVCIQHSAACSFDGDLLMTRLQTAFYHYGMPMVNKQFIKVVFEATAQKGTKVTFQALFDYGDSDVPSSESIAYYASGSGGIWGLDVWGQFNWVGKLAEIIEMYSLGYGYNMSLLVTTSSKIHQPHVLNNMSILYKQRNIKW